ncbi:hypothetical protein, partial [Streptomyces sp. NPDC055699]
GAGAGGAGFARAAVGCAAWRARPGARARGRVRERRGRVRERRGRVRERRAGCASGGPGARAAGQAPGW